MQHIPIMVDEILNMMGEIPQGVNHYLDGTFGRGGHLRAVLNRFPKSQAVAIDRDLSAIAHAKSKFASEIESKRLVVFHAEFSEIQNLLLTGKMPFAEFDAILLDLGVSSPQLDEAARGFSFINDGPLDMRMNQNQTLKASDLINELEEEELKWIFKEFGEVRSPFRVVRAIVHDRKTTPFSTTSQLADLIARVEGWKKKGIHPATQYFMALRIRVNNELDPLKESLRFLMGLLNEGGRLFVITFHSLEDRIVKQTMNESMDLGLPVNKRVIVPSDMEQNKNPRSRSAKLRVFQRVTGAASLVGKKNKYADKKGH